jgi:hypothetical protein
MAPMMFSASPRWFQCSGSCLPLARQRRIVAANAPLRICSLGGWER